MTSSISANKSSSNNFAFFVFVFSENKEPSGSSPRSESKRSVATLDFDFFSDFPDVANKSSENRSSFFLVVFDELNKSSSSSVDIENYQVETCFNQSYQVISS